MRREKNFESCDKKKKRLTKILVTACCKWASLNTDPWVPWKLSYWPIICWHHESPKRELRWTSIILDTITAILSAVAWNQVKYLLQFYQV